MSDGRLDRLKQALQNAFLTQIPDHPANGGNTGEAEWPADDQEEGEDAENDERPQ